MKLISTFGCDDKMGDSTGRSESVWPLRDSEPRRARKALVACITLEFL